jgi:ribbon-helix-helix protein, copG family
MNHNKKRFTLRLDEEEYKELSRIKGLTGTKTSTKAIRYLISHFVELNNRYIEEINKNAALKEKYKKQDRCVENLLKTLGTLKELKCLEVVLPEKEHVKR